MSYEPGAPPEEGEFNSAFAYLFRIDQCYQQIDRATFEEDVIKHFKICRVLFKELWPMMSKDEKEELLDIFGQAWNYYKGIMDKQANPRGNIPFEFIECLDWFDMRLRDCTQSHRLLMPKKKDARYALST